MQDLNAFLKDGAASKLTGDAAKLEQLRDAPETRRIFSMLSRSTGDLEQAADRAANGDTAQLVSAIRQLMRDPEGQKLIEAMRQNLK